MTMSCSIFACRPTRAYNCVATPSAHQGKEIGKVCVFPPISKWKTQTRKGTF